VAYRIDLVRALAAKDRRTLELCLRVSLGFGRKGCTRSVFAKRLLECVPALVSQPFERGSAVPRANDLRAKLAQRPVYERTGDRITLGGGRPVEAEREDLTESRKRLEVQHGVGPLRVGEGIVFARRRNRDPLDEARIRQEPPDGPGDAKRPLTKAPGDDVGELVPEHGMGIGSNLEVDLLPPRLCDERVRRAHEPLLLGSVAEEDGRHAIRAPRSERPFDGG
jgi:hypothetical protein